MAAGGVFNDRRRTQTAGQQGLFPAAPHMSAAARFPRGYTPERQRDVMGALRANEPHPQFRSTAGEAAKGPALQPVDRSPDSWGDHDRALALRENGLHHQGVIDAIARSTIPVGHLKERPDGPYQNQEGQARIGHIAVNRKWSDAERVSGMYFEHGHHHRESNHDELLPYRSIVLRDHFGRNRTDTPRGPAAGGSGLLPRNFSQQVSLKADHNTAQTLIHELGHHHSAAHEDWDAHLNRQEYDYNTQVHPAEEGFADNYADTHYRPDPRFKGGNGNGSRDYMSGYASLIGHHEDYRRERPNPQSQTDRNTIALKANPRVAARRKPIAASPGAHPLEQLGLF